MFISPCLLSKRALFSYELVSSKGSVGWWLLRLSIFNVDIKLIPGAMGLLVSPPFFYLRLSIVHYDTLFCLTPLSKYTYLTGSCSANQITAAQYISPNAGVWRL